MEFAKKSRLFLLLFLTALLLCGCGEEAKGNAYLKEGNYKEAIGVYEKLVSKKDSKGAKEKNQKLYSLMGEAHCYLEEYGAALECFAKAMELAKEDVEAELYLYQGLCFEKLAQYQEAIEGYEMYFAKLPEETEADVKKLPAEELSTRAFAYNELGLCYLKQEEPKKALEAILAGLALEPEGEVWQGLARNKVIVLEHLAQFEEAYAECSAYLEDYPEDEEMLREYEFLKTRV